MGVTESAIRKLIEKATYTMKPIAYKVLRHFEGEEFEIEEDDNLAHEMIYRSTSYLRLFLRMK